MSGRAGIAASIGDVDTLAVSYARHLRAANLSPKTYGEATEGLRRSLVERGMAT